MRRILVPGRLAVGLGLLLGSLVGAEDPPPSTVPGERFLEVHVDLAALRAAGGMAAYAHCWDQIAAEVGQAAHAPVTSADLQAYWRAGLALDLRTGPAPEDRWTLEFIRPPVLAGPDPFPAVPAVSGPGLQVSFRTQGATTPAPPRSTPSRAAIQGEIQVEAAINQQMDAGVRTLARRLLPRSIHLDGTPTAQGTEDRIVCAGGPVFLGPITADALADLPADSFLAAALGVDGAALAQALAGTSPDPVLALLDQALHRTDARPGTLSERLSPLRGAITFALVPRPGLPGWCLDFPDDPHWRSLVLSPILARGFLKSEVEEDRWQLPAGDSRPFTISIGRRHGRWRITSDPTMLAPVPGQIPGWASDWTGNSIAMRFDVATMLRYAGFAVGFTSISEEWKQVVRKGVQALQVVPLGTAEFTGRSVDGNLTCTGANATLAGLTLMPALARWNPWVTKTVHDVQYDTTLEALRKALPDPQPRLIYDTEDAVWKDLIKGEPWAVITGRIAECQDLPLAVANPDLGLGCCLWIDQAGTPWHSDGERGRQLWDESRRLIAQGRPLTADDWAPVMRERRRLRFGDPVIVHPRNFAMSAMPQGWRQEEVDKDLHPDWSAAWSSPDRKTLVLVIAEELDRDDAKTRRVVVEAVQASLRQTITNAAFETGSCGVDGFLADRLTTRGQVNGREQVNERAIITHRGWIWQIIALAEPRARIAPEEALQLACQRFAVRDRHLASPQLQASAPAGVVRHRTLPCELDLTGSEWQVLADTSKVNAAASIALFHPPSHTWAMVFAAALDGKTCSDRAVLAGMLAQIGQSFPEAVAGGERTTSLLGAPASEVIFSRGKSPRARMAVRTARVADTALGIFLWRSGEESPLDAPGVTLLASLKPVDQPAHPLPETTAVFVQTVADWYVGKDMPKEAWPWAEAHAVEHAGDTDSVGRALRILNNQEQWTRALAWYRAHAARLAEEDLAIASWEPWLRHKCGETAEAMELYGRLFDRGWISQEDFALYVATRHARGEKEAAYAAFTRWPKMGGSSAARRQRTKLLHLDGRDEEAVRALAELARSGKDEDLLDQADGLIELERHHEARGLLTNLLRSHPGMHRAWQLSGIAEYRLGWYHDAVKSLERALAIDPANVQDSEWLKAARQALGRGDNGALQQVLPEVAPPAEGPALPGEPPQDGTVGSRWLLSEHRIHWQAGGDLDHTRRKVVHLADQAACADFATVEIPVDTEGETLYVHGLWVTAPGGQRTDMLRREDCYLIDMPGSIAGSERLARIPAPGLVPGCVLEWSYTTRQSRAKKCWIPIRIPSQQACERVQVTVTGDVKLLKTVVRGGWTTRETTAGVAYRLGPQPIARGGAFLDPAGSDLPGLTIGRAEPSWDALGKEYLADLANLLIPDVHGNQVASTWVAPGTPADQVAACLLRKVSERLSYSAVAFGRSARIPRPMGEILARNQGDCKDHSLLLWHLLRARGLPAHLALVHASGHAIVAETPSLDQFDHMVVCLTDPTGAVDRVLDATADHQDPTLRIPSGLGGCTLLVLDPAAPRLAKAPVYELSSIEAERTVRILAEGQLAVDETVRFSGHYAGYFRQRFTDRSVEDRLAQVQRLYDSSATQVERLELADLEDPSRPLVLRLTWRPRIRLVAGEGGGLAGDLPDHWAEWMFRLAAEPGRTRTVVAQWPITITSTTQVVAPSGWVAKEQEPSPDDGDAWYSWSSQPTASGVKRTIRELPGNWPSDRFPDLVKRTDQVLDRAVVRIRLKHRLQEF